jgi:hypothetical protein
MTVTAGAEMLRNAAKVIEDRHATYGPPNDNFQNIADFWTVYVNHDDVEFTPADVAAMMSLVKIARIMMTPEHGDSWVDLAGYAACGAEVTEDVRTRVENGELVRDAEGRLHPNYPSRQPPTMPEGDDDDLEFDIPFINDALAEANPSTSEPLPNINRDPLPYWENRVAQAQAYPAVTMPSVSEDEIDEDPIVDTNR